MSDEDTFCNLKWCSGMYNKVINNAHILKLIPWDKQGNSFGNINWSGVQRKKCCEQCWHVKFKDTMTKERRKTNTQNSAKHAEHQDATYIMTKNYCLCCSDVSTFIVYLYIS